MPFELKQVRYRLQLLLALMAAGGDVFSGNGLFGTLPGELNVSDLRPQTGKQITFTLTLRPSQSLVAAAITAEASPCMALEGRNRITQVPLQEGQPFSFSFKGRVRKNIPCLITATVLQTDESNARTGWSYSVELNKRIEDKNSIKRGRDAQGNSTVEVQVNK